MPDRPNIRATIQIPERGAPISRSAHDYGPRPRSSHTRYCRCVRAHDVRQRDAQRRLLVRIQRLPWPLHAPHAHSVVPRARHERARIGEYRTGARCRLDDLHDLVIHDDAQVSARVEAGLPNYALVGKAGDAHCAVGVGDHLLAYGIERELPDRISWTEI